MLTQADFSTNRGANAPEALPEFPIHRDEGSGRRAVSGISQRADRAIIVTRTDNSQQNKVTMNVNNTEFPPMRHDFSCMATVNQVGSS